MFSRAAVFRPSVDMKDILEEESLADRGELPYHEIISSKTYKQVFAQLDLTNMKNARQVCKKWHHEIFPLMEEKSVFTFKGDNNHSDLTQARGLAEFLKVVQRDGFQWKMLRILYPNPESALPTPLLIQWSHLRLYGSSFQELKQWVSRAHTPNISFLDLKNVPLSWTKYFVILREFENLSKLQDTCTDLSNGIFEEFEKGCAPNEKLQESPDFLQLRIEDVTFLSNILTHVHIQRARLEEVILYLKMLSAIDCKSLETLELSAADCFGGLNKSRKKNTRLSELKMIMFSHLGSILKNNANTLSTLKLSFVHSSISDCFDQYAKNYEDPDGNLYKPDVREFIAYLIYHRWSEFGLRALSSLTLEFENRKISSVEEIEGFASFLNSLKSLKYLNISHFLLTSYNSLSLPLILKRLGRPTSNSSCQCTFGVSLRNEADGQVLLPTNLDLYYSNISSIVVTCHSKDTDLKATLFSSENKCEKSIQNFWLIDNRPLGKTSSLFSMRQIVLSYPNLTSFIVKDSVNSLRCCSNDLSRWAIIDDYGMQLILKHLKNLRHLDLSGNLFYVTDCGITGISPKGCERMLTEKNFRLKKHEMKGNSFSNLRNLEHCCLQYLGSKVTDISIYLGFNGLINLKTLLLSGLTQISEDGIEAINNKFPVSNGCKITIMSCEI